MPPILYFIANAIPNLKNVVVEALVVKSSILDWNRASIIDRNFATFHTTEILKTISITDKKGNTYDTAMDIYTDDMCHDTCHTTCESSVFKVGKSNNFKLRVKCYLTRDTAISHFIFNKPQKCITYNDDGDILRNGLLWDGLFTGTIKENTTKSIVKYKDGIQEI
jgi:hypothetical protein